MQSSLEGKISELHSQIKVKTFEMERTTINYEETVSNLKQCNLIIDQQRKKIEIITGEYYQLQNITTKEIAELKTYLNEQSEKLSSFESLEKDLDLALLTANEDMDNLLPTLGNTSNPTNKRRIRQTLMLSRKILEMQKSNQELSHLLEEEKRCSEHLSQEVRKNSTT
jgi:hypothetical protein